MTFSDGYGLRNKAVANINRIADAIDDLCTVEEGTAGVTLISTTSTGFVDYTGGSVTVDAVAGQKLRFDAIVLASHGFTVDGFATFRWLHNGVQVGINSEHSFPVLSALGNSTTLPMRHTLTVTDSGAQEVKIQWKSSGGIIYSASFDMSVEVLQQA